MEKLISLLGVFSLSCVSTMTLSSCNNIDNNKPQIPNNKLNNDLKVNLKTNIDGSKKKFYFL